jgi:hypothetical protein
MLLFNSNPRKQLKQEPSTPKESWTLNLRSTLKVETKVKISPYNGQMGALQLDD